jgi:hypothetical protein
MGMEFLTEFFNAVPFLLLSHLMGTLSAIWDDLFKIELHKQKFWQLSILQTACQK